MGDLVLRNGHVIDPANGINEVSDVRISEGKIDAVARNLPEQPGDRSIDVSGLYVTPGIIDMHAHVAHTHSRSTLSLHPLVNTLESGVTTTVDAGTCGWRDFDQFRVDVIDASTKIRVLSYVNIVGSGMGGAWEHEAPEMNPQLCADTALMHSDVVVGIKTAHYWAKQRFDANHLPWTAIDRALEAGIRADMPMMVDFCPELPNRPYPTLLEKMRPGDIHTHVFAQQFPIIDDNGKVFEYMYQAREKGIIFDLGHGAGSFWFRNAVPAIQEGFVPDSISTDLHTGNVAGVVIDMLGCMNKVLNIGVSLEEVILRSTVTPAKEINRPELGTLSVGASADVAVFNLEKGDYTFIDCEKTTMQGDKKLVCDMTIFGGDIVYNANWRGHKSWEQDLIDNPTPFHVRTQTQF